MKLTPAGFLFIANKNDTYAAPETPPIQFTGSTSGAVLLYMDIFYKEAAPAGGLKLEIIETIMIIGRKMITARSFKKNKKMISQIRC